MKSHLACTLAAFGLALGSFSCASQAPDGPPTIGQSMASDWNDAMADAYALVMPSDLTETRAGEQSLWQSTLDVFDRNPGHDFGNDTDREYGWRAAMASKPSASYGINKWVLNYDPKDPSH